MARHEVWPWSSHNAPRFPRMNVTRKDARDDISPTCIQKALWAALEVLILESCQLLDASRVQVANSALKIC